MLAFGRRQLLKPEVVDVSAVVRDIERLLRPLLAAEVRVALNLPQPCWAHVDRSQLELVIMNLAMNARDAMPRGGSLTIETSFVDLGAAERQRHPNVALAPGHYVRVSISDTGSGIAPEVRDRIFEPFFTTKPVGKGTGLGLSTVYGIISNPTATSGSTARSGTARQCTCTCRPRRPPMPKPRTVPRMLANAGARAAVRAGRSLRNTPPRSHSPKTSRHAERRGEHTVLVVDDEAALRAAAVRALRDAGFRVLEAESEEHALALAGEGPLDVLLTDVIMPSLDGVAVAARILEQQPNVRVIYMSGYPQTHFVSNGRLRGSYTFVAKPFTAWSFARRSTARPQSGRERAARVSGRT